MSKKRLIIIVLSICAIIGLVFGGLYFNSQMEKPLGPSLKGNSTGASGSSNSNSDEMPTSASVAAGGLSTSIPQPGGSVTPGGGTNQLPTPIPVSSQNKTNQLRPLCGKTPVLTVLVVGLGYYGNDYLYGLADVIKIARIDFTTHKVSVLTLDRAIWVEIPGIADHYGITHGALNQAYFYGVPAMGYYDGPGGGAGLLAETLKKNFGLDVDNYVVVSMAAFVKMVDALGGIDVYLPEPVDGTAFVARNGEPFGEFGYFNAGLNHLSGQQALNLALIRGRYSTLVRDRNQDLIVKALFEQISSPSVITKAPKLLQALQGTVLTDLSPRQIESMICLFKKMGSTDLSLVEIPEKYYVSSWIYSQDMHQDINIWDIDFDIFRSYISKFMNGQWP